MPSSFLATCQDGCVRLYDARMQQLRANGGPAPQRWPRGMGAMGGGGSGGGGAGGRGGGAPVVVNLSGCGLSTHRQSLDNLLTFYLLL